MAGISIDILEANEKLRAEQACNQTLPRLSSEEETFHM
jgi:hypothetical protein